LLNTEKEKKALEKLRKEVSGKGKGKGERSGLAAAVTMRKRNCHMNNSKRPFPRLREKEEGGVRSVSWTGNA